MNDYEDALMFSVLQREPVLRKELSKVRHPVREYTFPRHIWLPSRWIVHRHLYGEIERIPTVIIDTPTNTSSRHMFPDEVSHQSFCLNF